MGYLRVLAAQVLSLLPGPCYANSYCPVNSQCHALLLALTELRLVSTVKD